MIIFEGKGDLFNCGANTLIVPVNCNGVMGAGLAKAVVDRYPSVMGPYKRQCKLGNFRIGCLMVHRINPDLRLLLLPTKKDWWDDSELSYILAALTKFTNTPKLERFGKIACPMLGTGCGKLDHDVVLEIMKAFFGRIDNDVLLITAKK